MFAQPEHPLALFLDDLQWLDTATLELLEHLATHPEVRHVLLIGAYRDNEVGPSHALPPILNAIRDAGGRLHEIVLAPLTSADVKQLVAELLHCSRETAAPLAELIHEKTDGNPFFAIQFLTALVEEELLRFDHSTAIVDLGYATHPRQGFHRQRGRSHGREACTPVSRLAKCLGATGLLRQQRRLRVRLLRCTGVPKSR